MAVRNESVRLSLDDDFTSKMARAAASVAVFKKELGGLDGKNVGRGLDDTAKSVDGVGSSSRKAGPDIDKLSGRLRILTDAAVVLGPTALTLGAGSIPILTASIAGLGAAAGGLGVTILAFKGLDDALKALDDYRLEPTAQNLQKLRVEQEKLGASGTQFLRYIDNLEPVLRTLQNTARDGIFPGVEKGVDDLLTRLPQVRTIISELSQGIGGIAAGAGKSLGGADFDNFFSYLETDARPTLESFAKSAGNVALGVANMIVAFAPLSRDFTGGLEDATKAFANWSKGLDNNDSFQSFMSYVRESGPQLRAFAAATVNAFAGLAEAAAPFGSTLLPVLTQVLRLFGAIAQSPFGPAIYGSVAAFTALNRVAQLSSATLDRLSLSSDKTRSSLSKIASVGTGIIGVGMAVGALGDSIHRIDPENLDRSLTALTNGDVTGDIDKVVESLSQLNDPLNKVDLGEVVTLGGLFGDDSLDRYANNIDEVDKKLAQLVETGQQAQASQIFKSISDLASARGVSPDATAKQFDAYSLALKNAAAATAGLGESTGPIPGYIGDVIQSLANGATAAQDFSAALAELNGWFDKRDALRAYGDSLDALTQGLKNGFSREDEANIDAVGRSILQVANNIKNPGTRANFLANAREELVSMAKTAAPAAKKALQEVINKFDDKGLTNPPPIKLSADDKAAEAAFARTRRAAAQVSKTKVEPKVTADTAPAIKSFNQVESQATALDRFTATPAVTVQTGGALDVIGNVRRALDALNGHTANTYVVTNRIGGVTSSAGGHSAPVDGSADGSTVPKTGRGYADRHLYLLADGEEVISNRYGQADRNRSLLKAINSNRLAAGGSIPGGGGFQEGNGAFGSGDVTNAAKGASGALKVLELRLKRVEAAAARQEKALDRQTAKLDSLTSAQASLASSTSSSLLHDSFGNGLAGLQSQSDADAADADNMLAALKTLVAKGLSPDSALFQQLAASGDVNTAQQLAALDTQGVAVEQARFQGTQSATAAVGQYAGQKTYGPDIKLQTKAVNEQRDATKALNQTVRSLNQEVKHMKDEIAKMKKHVKDGAKEGTREGQQDKDRTTHQNRRTGSR